MGRALYRERDPSRDGDPVPGSLPYFFFFIIHFVSFFSDDLLVFPFYTTLINSLECLSIVYSSFYFITSANVSLLNGKFTLFLHS